MSCLRLPVLRLLAGACTLGLLGLMVHLGGSIWAVSTTEDQEIQVQQMISSRQVEDQLATMQDIDPDVIEGENRELVKTNKRLRRMAVKMDDEYKTLFDDYDIHLQNSYDIQHWPFADAQFRKYVKMLSKPAPDMFGDRRDRKKDLHWAALWRKRANEYRNKTAREAECVLKAASQPSYLPRNSSSTLKLTLVISTYKSDGCLRKSLAFWGTCDNVIEEIRINWFERRDPPKLQKAGSIPVTVDRFKNELANRFLPRDFATDAIFTVDVDTLYPCGTLQRALNLWENGDGNDLVGFHPRSVDTTTGVYKWHTSYRPPFRYDVVLPTKGSILHRKFYEFFFQEKYDVHREMVNLKITAEDFLMYMVHKTETNFRPPIVLCLNLLESVPLHDCSDSLSHRTGGENRRQAILRLLDAFPDTMQTHDESTMRWPCNASRHMCSVDKDGYTEFLQNDFSMELLMSRQIPKHCGIPKNWTGECRFEDLPLNTSLMATPENSTRPHMYVDA